MGLFNPLAEADVPANPVLPPPRDRPIAVSLTATGRQEGDRFVLDDEDLHHPILRQRLDAHKPTKFVEHAPGSDPASHLADATASLLADQADPCSCVVFVNTPAVAREVADHIERSDAEIDVVVLTGRLREREAQAMRQRVLDPVIGAPSGRDPQPRSRHLVVVATQTLEVGADLDFDLLVTESCGVRALTQRLGRLNRLGAHEIAAATIVHVPSKPQRGHEAFWPVYGLEPAAVAERVRAVTVGEPVDLCPRRVAEVLGVPADDPGRAPEVLPALVDEWAKTTTTPPGEAPVEPFFSGITQPERRVAVCWRAFLPADGELLWPRVRDFETIDLPLAEFHSWASRSATVIRLAPDRVHVEEVEPHQIRPGETVVLPTDAGGYDERGWAPNSDAPVLDVTLMSHGIPIDGDALNRIVEPLRGGIGRLVAEIVAPPDDADTDLAEAGQRLLDALRSAVPRAVPEPEWAEGLTRLEPIPVHALGEPWRFMVAPAGDEGVASDELDELSLARSAIDLVAHGEAVRDRSADIARRLGVAPEVVDSAATGAWLHDVGKADPRFQRWLDPDNSRAELVAKSNRPRSRWQADRRAAGWPSGGRHEALSARLAREWLAGSSPRVADEDLLLHVVLTHHGHGRPLVVPVEDGAIHAVEMTLGDTKLAVPADLSAVDWTQPSRFHALNERYGRWGLALLEAIVRQSDHAVSAGRLGAVEVV